MGVEYSATIVVGLPVQEFEDRDDYCDLEIVAPYYDGGSDAVAGVVVSYSGDYSRKEIDIEMIATQIETAKIEFKDVTGKDGKVYLSTSGY